MTLGTHSMVDVAGCNPVLLDDPDRLRVLLEDACRRSGATVLRTVAHQFQPQGVTVLCLLAESHASVHTYPELGRAMVDVFTCGSPDPVVAAEHVAKALGGAYVMRTILRPIDA